MLEYSDKEAVSALQNRNDAYYEIVALAEQKMPLCRDAERTQLFNFRESAQEQLRSGFETLDELKALDVAGISANLKTAIAAVKTDADYRAEEAKAQAQVQPAEIVDLPAVKIAKPKAAKKKVKVKWKKVRIK